MMTATTAIDENIKKCILLEMEKARASPSCSTTVANVTNEEAKLKDKCDADDCSEAAVFYCPKCEVSLCETCMNSVHMKLKAHKSIVVPVNERSELLKVL